MEAPLNILYTGNIRGDLHGLPRLFSFIQQRRHALPQGERLILLDLGMSCVPEVWPCGVTQGRSTLLVLDAMGYHVANTSGVLPPLSRKKLVDQVSIALVDETHFHTDDGIFYTLQPQAGRPNLQLILSPAAETALHDKRLFLAGVEKGQLGQVRLHNGLLTDVEIHPLPASIPANPTIAGTVDFVESEARYYEKKQD